MIRASQVFAAMFAFSLVAPALGAWTYNPATGHWYQLTPSGLTWQQAENWAVANGAHLTAINNAVENSWVASTFGVNLWIGLFQLPGSSEPAGGWTWSNGESVSYINWAPGEPNNFNQGPGCSTEDFGYISDFPGNGTQWVDTTQCATFAGIVERAVDPAVPTVSTWGVAVMTLLTLAAGTVVLNRRRVRAAG